jgi:dynein heavy chain 1
MAQAVRKWALDVSNKKTDIRGPIFSFQKKAGSFTINVNFDMSISTLVKEARQLGSLRIKIPPNIESFMSDFGEIFPHAVSLQESVRTYQVNNSLVSSL